MNTPDPDSIECEGCVFFDTWWETPDQRVNECLITQRHYRTGDCHRITQEEIDESESEEE